MNNNKSKKSASSKIRELFSNTINRELKDLEHKKTSKFRTPLVTPKEFFEDWLKTPLFPAQYSAVNHIFTEDYQDLRTDINEIMLKWAEGSGKNFTCARTLAYVAYWLVNLIDPQEYLGVGKNTPIVLVNVSFREEHAKGIFFRQFVECIKSTINPRTGNNWFEEQGMDLREGKDIQTRKTLFPRHIEAVAENSVHYTAEGKNILVAVFDEIAEFRYDKAKLLYNNLKNTAFSRFPHHYKIISISYPRDPYDFFVQLYDSVDSLPEKERSKVYRETKAAWQIRNKKGAHPILIKKRAYRTKEDYAPAYRIDPEDAARRFECKFLHGYKGRFLKRFELVLEKCVNFDRPVPYILESDSLAITDVELLNLTWQAWFKPRYSYEAYLLEQKYIKNRTDTLENQINKELERHEFAQYFVHIDLSRGIEDFAGLTLLHTYKHLPTSVGYYVDLAIQIKPESDEIEFDNLYKFILQLLSMGFDIQKVTFDGFQSTHLIQKLENNNVECDIISVDRSRKPYDTLKHLLYQGLVNIYYYAPLVRELKELIITPTGKVDHPKESKQRLMEEGIKKGSKDVADSLAAAVYSALVTSQSTENIVISTLDVDIDNLDKLNKIL